MEKLSFGKISKDNFIELDNDKPRFYFRHIAYDEMYKQLVFVFTTKDPEDPEIEEMEGISVDPRCIKQTGIKNELFILDNAITFEEPFYGIGFVHKDSYIAKNKIK